VGMVLRRGMWWRWWERGRGVVMGSVRTVSDGVWGWWC
jgi:hypothetical protein